MRFGKINTIWDVLNRYYNRSDIALLDDIDDVSKALDLLGEYKNSLIQSPDFSEMKYIEILEVYEDFLVQKNYLTSMKLIELSNIALKLNSDLTKLRGDYSQNLGMMEKNMFDSEQIFSELKNLLDANQRLSDELTNFQAKEPSSCFIQKIKNFFTRSNSKRL